VLDPIAHVSDERIEMTDWELQDFAVQVVRVHLAWISEGASFAGAVQPVQDRPE
jgi:hypothetical protein